MIVTKIPELLEIVGIQHSWDGARGRSECPLHGDENPKDFMFSSHMARCSSCRWMGNSSELAKKLELYAPSELRKEGGLVSFLSWFLPKDPRVIRLDAFLGIERSEVCFFFDLFKEMEGNGEMNSSLHKIECENRWSQYLDRSEHLYSERESFIAEGVRYGSH